MKNFAKILALAGVLLLGACDEDKSLGAQDISDSQIYFFYQSSCPHCHHASQYIAQKYPDLKMQNLNVRTPENFNLLLKCAQKFNLPQESLGTPLICMGDHYIMGWSAADANKFDIYVRRFQ